MGTRRKTATLSLRLEPSLKHRAEKVAKADHRTLTSLIEKLLSDRIAQQESGKPAAKYLKHVGVTSSAARSRRRD